MLQAERSQPQGIVAWQGGCRCTSTGRQSLRRASRQLLSPSHILHFYSIMGMTHLFFYFLLCQSQRVVWELLSIYRVLLWRLRWDIWRGGVKWFEKINWPDENFGEMPGSQDEGHLERGIVRTFQREVNSATHINTVPHTKTAQVPHQHSWTHRQQHKSVRGMEDTHTHTHEVSVTVGSRCAKSATAFWECVVHVASSLCVVVILTAQHKAWYFL